MASVLAQEFTRSVDGMKSHTFKQLKRTGNVCLYARHDPDKPTDTMFGYEVFTVTVVPQTAKFGTPGDEIYPRANTFGRTAWFCQTLERAQNVFNGLCQQ